MKVQVRVFLDPAQLRLVKRLKREGWGRTDSEVIRRIIAEWELLRQFVRRGKR